MSAIEDIAAERRRQIEAEGWVPEHDDEHSRGQMAMAASAYAYSAGCNTGKTAGPFTPIWWPWEQSWWKPNPTDPRRDLVKAAALILAEIERIDRAAERARREADANVSACGNSLVTGYPLNDAEQYRQERDTAFSVIRNTLVALEAQSAAPQVAGSLRTLVNRINETGTIIGPWPPNA